MCNLFIPKPNGVKLKESARPEQGHGRLLTIRTNSEHGCLQSCCACDRSQIKALCRPLLPFASGCFPELDRDCSCVLKLLLNTSIVAEDQVVAGGCLLSLLIPFNSNIVVVLFSLCGDWICPEAHLLHHKIFQLDLQCSVTGMPYVMCGITSPGELTALS